jgi:hypothetical protein
MIELQRRVSNARREYEAARWACSPDAVTERLRAAARDLADAELALKRKGVAAIGRGAVGASG